MRETNTKKNKGVFFTAPKTRETKQYKTKMNFTEKTRKEKGDFIKLGYLLKI